MASSATEKIGGRVFSFGTIPATEALSVQVSIMRVIGEPLFKALAGQSSGAEGSKEKILEIGGAAVGVMASRMDAPELLRTMETVFKYVTVDGQRINIDTHFTGRPKELWQVFLKALRVNFSDFTDGLSFDLPHAQA